MECKHPMQFWALYRSRVRDRFKRDRYYRCPACGARVEMEVPVLSGALDVLILALAVLTGTGIQRILLRANVGFWSFPPSLAAYCVAIFLLYIPVCRIGLRLGCYTIGESDELPL